MEEKERQNVNNRRGVCRYPSVLFLFFLKTNTLCNDRDGRSHKSKQKNSSRLIHCLVFTSLGGWL